MARNRKKMKAGVRRTAAQKRASKRAPRKMTRHYAAAITNIEFGEAAAKSKPKRVRHGFRHDWNNAGNVDKPGTAYRWSDGDIRKYPRPSLKE